MSEVVVVRTGLANLASVLAGLRRAGAQPVLTADPDEVREATAVVLPGVGSFGPAIEQLASRGLVAPLRDRIERGAPTLAICLGMQLLLEGSDESPGSDGLAVAAGRAERFGDSERVPQLGWNRIEPADGCKLLRAGAVYFANSYRLASPPDGWSTASADHGGPFVAAMEKDGVVACQFHPELSGPLGVELLRRWLGGEAC